jgi:short-subunit dehydrogenase
VLYTSSVLAYVPIASNAIYSATKAALHSYALSQRFQLRGTGVRVQEIAPPWVDTDLIYKSGDPRAMPLPDFIEQTLVALATDAPEVIVEGIKAMRDNPGANEHARSKPSTRALSKTHPDRRLSRGRQSERRKERIMSRISIPETAAAPKDRKPR